MPETGYDTFRSLKFTLEDQMKKSVRLRSPILLCAILAVLAACDSGSSASATSRKTADLNANATGKTIIRLISTDKTYPNNSCEIISKSGAIIVADPFKPLSGIKPDIITITHSHFDHNDPGGMTAAKISKWTAETFTVKDITVTSIESSHSGDTINNTNTIYIYEVDGLRIAHMGDIGQTRLTAPQLSALGRIDIAFMQFANSYSDYPDDGSKGIDLIEQLKPQIIIPTHSNAAATNAIGAAVGSIETADNEIAISRNDLSNGKRKVINMVNRN
jgi:hypothetical protein